MAKKHSKTSTKIYSDTIWGLVKNSFGIIFKNWRLFLPLFIIAILVSGLMIGISKDALVILVSLVIIMLWLTTIFMTRRILKGDKIKFRDGIFNAMAPFFSTLIIFVILMIQCLPIMLLVIAYSSAIETNLFGDFFAGSLFVLFALLMIALSGYLLSGTLMALIAVTAPGMYPLAALILTREVMVGEKMKFILRLFVLVLVLAAIIAVVTGVGVLIELWLNSMGQSSSAVVLGLYLSGCFGVIYAAVYLYLYYRKVLMMEEK